MLNPKLSSEIIEVAVNDPGSSQRQRPKVGKINYESSSVTMMPGRPVSKMPVNSGRCGKTLKKSPSGLELTWLHRVESEGTGGGYLKAIGKSHRWLSSVGDVSRVDGADSEIGRVVEQTTVFSPRQETRT